MSGECSSECAECSSESIECVERVDRVFDRVFDRSFVRIEDSIVRIDCSIELFYIPAKTPARAWLWRRFIMFVVRRAGGS